MAGENMIKGKNMGKKICIPPCRLACEDDDLKRKREELKRALREGRKLGVDWLKIFDSFLQNGNFKNDIPSGVSSKDIESKFNLVLFDPTEASVKGIVIPSGINDTFLYERSFKWLETFIYTFYIINKTYYILLQLSSSKKIKESANAFQKLLIDFFYDTISVDYADSNFSSLQDDWIVNMYTVDVGGYEICHKDYFNNISDEFIKKIEAFFLVPPKTIVGKKVYIRKVAKLIEMYLSWRGNSENLLRENLKIIFKQLI